MSNSLNIVGDGIRKLENKNPSTPDAPNGFILKFCLECNTFGGGGRIRTCEAEASDLQSDGFDRSPTPPIELCIL